MIKRFFTSMKNEIGEEKALAITKNVIDELAYENGKKLAKDLNGDTLKLFYKSLEPLVKNGWLEIEMLHESKNELSFKVTKCLFVKLYKNMEIHGLGKMLSCDRDFSMIKGFNKNIELHRTKTIMEGAKYCDFCFRYKGGENDAKITQE